MQVQTGFTFISTSFDYTHSDLDFLQNKHKITCDMYL